MSPNSERERSKTKSRLSRRSFLRGSAITAAAATGAIASPNIARAAPITLKMQGSWPAKSIYSEMAQQYTERVGKMSGGELKVEYLPVGAIVKDNQVHEACHTGTIDMAHTSATFWYERNKAALLFSGAPAFGCTGSQVLAWIHYGGGNKLYNELIQNTLKLDIEGFFGLPIPTQPLGWFKKHVTTPEDLVNMRYRTSPITIDFMSALGVEAVNLPADETVPAAKKSNLDAFEISDPSSDLRLGAPEARKHYHMSSFHRAAELIEIIINKKKFQGLSTAHQAIIEYAAEATNTANYGLAMDRFSADLGKIRKTKDVKIYRTDPAILRAQLAAWDRLITKNSKDETFKKIADSLKSWCARIGEYDITNTADVKIAFDYHFPGRLTF